MMLEGIASIDDVRYKYLHFIHVGNDMACDYQFEKIFARIRVILHLLNYNFVWLIKLIVLSIPDLVLYSLFHVTCQIH